MKHIPTKILLIIFLTVIPFNSLLGEDFQWASMGSLFLFASDNGPKADPPAILPSVGFLAAWRINEPLWIEVTGDVYFTNYTYNTEFGYPMACIPDSRSAFVIGLITAAQVTGNFPIGSNGTAIRVYGGPAIDIRIVTLAVGLHPDDIEDAQQKTNAISEYFWSNARWFLPVFGTGMDFPLNEHFLLGFDLRVWFPAYKLWTDDKAPAIDGWRFGAGLRITPRKKTAN
jgi:hypothetical protein